MSYHFTSVLTATDRESPIDGHAAKTLESMPRPELDAVARLAATSLGVAGAAIDLTDSARRFSIVFGRNPFGDLPVKAAENPLIARDGHPVIILDTRSDDRCSADPAIYAERAIRFYLGVPIVAGGRQVGTLCVFDGSPRDRLNKRDLATLEDIGHFAAELIETAPARMMRNIAAKVVEASNDAVIAASPDGTIIYLNPATERLFGGEGADAIGSPLEMIVSDTAPGNGERFAAMIAARTEGGCMPSAELIGVRADGSEFPLEVSITDWEEGHAGGIAIVARDISARKLLERARDRTWAVLDEVVRNLPGMLFVKDVRTRTFVMINEAGARLIGRPASEIVGSTSTELFPEIGTEYEMRDDEALNSRDPHVFESEFVRDDGARFHLRTTRVVIDGPEHPRQYLLSISEDVTEMRQAEAAVLRLAHYDTLTGLLNRSSFTDRVHRLLKEDQPFAVISLDLDRFKSVNDQFGHRVGDALLNETGKRLSALAGSNDIVARIGGDEFTMLLTGDNLRERTRGTAEDIIAALEEPFITSRAVAHVGASLGMVVVPEDGMDPDEIREHVDLALHRAKRQTKQKACFFDVAMDAEARDRQRLESQLREAVEQDEVSLVYQPVFSTRTGNVTSFEALARWSHPTRGPVPPDIFISLAEECGLIDTIGSRLMLRACIDAQSWPAQVRVAVNLSPMQFMSGNLLDTVRQALDRSGLLPDRLQLEVTEGLLIRDVDRTFAQLEKLRELGIQVLMDDFGVGYSSLSYFQRFRFDKVKLDKSFVRNVDSSREAQAVIQAVIGLGNSLGMGIVAEGVETEEQLHWLTNAGCTHIQGFLMSRPLDASNVEVFFEKKMALRHSSRHRHVRDESSSARSR